MRDRSEQAERTDDFAYHLRTGRRRAAVEVKFNPNHDAADGRFTFADGGVGVGGGAHQRHAASRAPASGPFREAALRQGQVGQTARAVNAFVQGRSGALTLPLGGEAGDVVVTRVRGSEVTLDNRFFTATGQVSVVPGREEIRLNLSDPKLKNIARYSGIFSLANSRFSVGFR